jgi:DNA-binding MarR family transcriptional regulator
MTGFTAEIASSPPAEGPSASAPREQIVLVADTVVDLLRSFNRTRARMLAAAAHDVEWSAHILLKCVFLEGPIRASALAETMQSDPSTVSRQVAALVKDGLLERRADPEDGRASLLVTTAKAQAVLADHDEIRIQHFSRMLADWPETELHRFAELLQRFRLDYDRASLELLRSKETSVGSGVFSVAPGQPTAALHHTIAAQHASPEGNS